MKRLIFDLDNTICFSSNGNYLDAAPNTVLIEKIREYKAQGFTIVISSSRNMRTYAQSMGLINVNTLPVIIDWLGNHNVPFDEVIVGKPWCGDDGFYVDDKAIRPGEFTNLTYDEIKKLVNIQ